MVSGTRAHAEALLDEVAEVLSGLGLRLAMDKTRVLHIDEGLDFLGWRIQRHRKRGTSKYYVYTYPAQKAVRSCAGKIKAICWQDVNLPLEALIKQLNSLLRGWTAYFRPGVSHRTFEFLRAVRKTSWKELRRRYCRGGWWPVDGEKKLFNPAAVRTTRYRYRGAAIPSPWPSTA
ncbi:group II intron maturase-specific domain-containing protein [Streptomyces sp. NPDC001455]|uniref:group II intron maturase-specific domain-containing protein n=1 Tax=Streptomyces sp. NPDC001455 TaxID=3154518 RepID=UPI00332733EC